MSDFALWVKYIFLVPKCKSCGELTDRESFCPKCRNLWRSTMSDFALRVKYIFLPQKCKACGELTDREGFCPKCQKSAESLKLKGEDIQLMIKNPFIKKFYASYYYDESPRRAVLVAKFYRPARFINTLLTDISIDIKEILSQNSIDIIMSVPFHKSKLWRFEFDLPKEMAKRMGIGFKIPVSCPVEKVKRTAKQHRLSLEERKVNLIGAFKAVGDVRDKNILLIDDVITSANTVIAVATQLKLAGAKDIIAWAYTYNNHKKGEKYGK